MFVILYYDVFAKRCNKMLKTCRKYLNWVQNSVFEGEIEEAALEKLLFELKRIMDDEDSLVVYRFRQMKYYKREVIGKDKKGDCQFI